MPTLAIAMKVIDHEPCCWFLLEGSKNLLLDVNCSHSFVGYTFLIQLTVEETQKYYQQGRTYLDWLAEDIHNSAPALKGSFSKYKKRNASSQFGRQVQEAIKIWHLEQAQATT